MSSPPDVRRPLNHSEAVQAWQALRTSEESRLAATASVHASRETRMDLQRRMDVIRRQHAALMAQSERRLARAEGELFAVRAVVAHRDEWFVRRLISALAAREISVVAATANGADAVAMAVVEQPDLLLVHDRLEMVPVPEVLADVRRLAPAALVVAQVEGQSEIASVLGSGAHAAFSRMVRPEEIAVTLSEMVGL